jgi:hypothetical protein
MIKQQVHKQPISRFSECDYRGTVIELNLLRGRFISILKHKL